MHYYCTIDTIKHTKNKPLNYALISYHNCNNQSELHAKAYGEYGLEIGASVYFAFNNEKYEGKVDAIIQYSKNSDKVSIGLTCVKDIPTENQMYSIFEFDNKFFLEPNQLEIKKNKQIKTLKIKKKDVQVNVI